MLMWGKETPTMRRQWRKHGFGRRNLEGQTVVDFAKRWELIVSNTMFVKRSMQKITYSSGGNNTQVDYILVRRRRMKEVWDTKVIMGESVAKQHRLVVSKMVMWTKWRKTTRPEKRTKWWKLREKEIQNQFREKVLESGIMESKGGYKAVANGIRDTARELLGAASGKEGKRRPRDVVVEQGSTTGGKGEERSEETVGWGKR